MRLQIRHKGNAWKTLLMDNFHTGGEPYTFHIIFHDEIRRMLKLQYDNIVIHYE